MRQVDIYMNTFTLREHRHGLLKHAAIALPLLAVIGCSSASSGHAPGVAGGQTLTPGITNFPLAYSKRPVLQKTIDAPDRITSITGRDLVILSQATRTGAHRHLHYLIHKIIISLRS